MLRYLEWLVAAVKGMKIRPRESMAIRRVRAKIAKRIPCEPGCPGWVVTIDRDGYEIDLASCEKCWRDHRPTLTRREILLLPEAMNERSRADADPDGYVPAVSGERCTCGNTLWRPRAPERGLRCTICGELRPT